MEYKGADGILSFFKDEEIANHAGPGQLPIVRSRILAHVKCDIVDIHTLTHSGQLRRLGLSSDDPAYLSVS